MKTMINSLKDNRKQKKNKCSELLKMEKDVKVSVRVVPIELPKIDVSKYIGKQVPILNVETYKGKFGLYVRIETKNVDVIKAKDKDIEIKGSRIFGLQQDKDGIYGYGKGTKLDLFVKKYGCKELEQLKGKLVILQTQTSDSGSDFLTFN